MSFPVKKQDTKYSYKDYLTWPENERWELIDGIAYNMTPAPSRWHQEISIALSNTFFNYLKNKPCKVYVSPFDVRLPAGNESDEEIETVVQPDILIVCDRSKLDSKGCKGAPDLIIEIMSPSTAKKDLKEKFDLYEKAGVKEYWIVDPNNKTVMVFKLDENKKYRKFDVYANEDSITVGIFEGLIIDLKEIFTE